MGEFESLKPYVKKLFEDLDIEKSDENVRIFQDFWEKVSKKFADAVIENIKEEFGSEKY